jgi:uncharacterized protein (DUF58 family)
VLGRVGDEFYGLREYRPGDDLRRVHWTSTARMDQLMIRQPENLLQGRLTVAVDLRVPIHDSSTLESALSAAASVVMAGIRNRIHVRLITTSGVDSGFGATAGHGAAILDILAEAQAQPGSTLLQDLRIGPGTGPITLITTQAATTAEVTAVTRSGRERATLVVFERSGDDGPRLMLDHHPARCRVVPVRAGSSFRAAWEGVLC